MGALRLAVAAYTIVHTATQAAVIGGIRVVIMFFHVSCSCVVHTYNMSFLRHIIVNSILHRTI